jgi:hypothetical protein
MDEEIKFTVLGFIAVSGGTPRNPLLTFHYKGKAFLYVATANPHGGRYTQSYIMTEDKKREIEKGTNEQLAVVRIQSLFYSVKENISTYECEDK